MKHHHGTSLLELLLIMSACTVLLTLTGMLLHRAMRIEIQSRAHVNAERTSLRLSAQFRSDVHRARAAAVDNTSKGDKAFLKLEFANGRTTEYSRAKNTVLRRESGGDRPAWREEFAFPPASTLTIEQKSDPQRVALTIVLKPADPVPTDKPPTRINPPSVSLCAEAVVGRDVRFETPRREEAQK